MKIPADALKEFVDNPRALGPLAERLTRAGLETTVVDGGLALEVDVVIAQRAAAATEAKEVIVPSVEPGAIQLSGELGEGDIDARALELRLSEQVAGVRSGTGREEFQGQSIGESRLSQ